MKFPKRLNYRQQKIKLTWPVRLPACRQASALALAKPLGNKQKKDNEENINVLDLSNID
jgi:hypothetical protein